MSSIEVLVQDGGSDSIERIAIQYDGLAEFESVKDLGIYDGMNRALARSTGQYVWFLNGGDTSIVSEWKLLERELVKFPSQVLFAGYVLKTGNRVIPRDSRQSSYIWHGLPTSHQAIFYPGAVIRREQYDLAYRIVGDYEVTARILAQGTPSRVIELRVAAFLTGGTSQTHSDLIAIEAKRVQRSVLKTGRMRQIMSRLLHRVSSYRRQLQTHP